MDRPKGMFATNPAELAEIARGALREGDEMRVNNDLWCRLGAELKVTPGPFTGDYDHNAFWLAFDEIADEFDGVEPLYAGHHLKLPGDKRCGPDGLNRLVNKLLGVVECPVCRWKDPRDRTENDE